MADRYTRYSKTTPFTTAEVRRIHRRKMILRWLIAVLVTYSIIGLDPGSCCEMPQRTCP